MCVYVMLVPIKTKTNQTIKKQKNKPCFFVFRSMGVFICTATQTNKPTNQQTNKPTNQQTNKPTNQQLSHIHIYAGLRLMVIKHLGASTGTEFVLVDSWSLSQLLPSLSQSSPFKSSVVSQVITSPTLGENVST
jgi:hypothetical protein